MLAAQRQSAILDAVRATGGVRVADLVDRFGVSDMTIRRDLEMLSDRGLILKVHGGATALRPGATEEPGFAAKAELHQRQKDAIAEKAAGLVQPGTAIALSAGTTTARLAQRLTAVEGLTVVTNSIPVAELFHRAGRPDQTVVLTGGVRTPSDALVGPIASAAVRSLHVDLLFLGVHGMSARAGFTTPNLLEAETDRALIDSARRTVVVADSSKWDVVGIATIADLAAAQVLVTDDQLPDEAREALTHAEIV
ncbi:DeoR/GlpR family DNA-binding transcription regulator [Hamadaea sp. NPDC051192]|uniref:DeoR/GlpR family DNA-binding transcription regulator n=1 Tax=Hamadaea sp. NPDC051192 TaxID=3154940 RepID=UPI003418B945